MVFYFNAARKVYIYIYIVFLTCLVHLYENLRLKGLRLQPYVHCNHWSKSYFESEVCEKLSCISISANYEELAMFFKNYHLPAFSPPCYLDCTYLSQILKVKTETEVRNNIGQFLLSLDFC